LVCYCDDCQSFAHFLGGAERILDANGGTDIFQMSPARLEFSEGVEQLACIRLTPGGMLRWHARCCNTPIGNTMAARGIPFVGLIHSCVDHAADRNAALGPIRARINGRFAKGDRAQLEAHDRAPLSLIFHFVPMILRARLRGDHNRSPFFDTKTGKLRVEPRVLTAEELREVERTRDG
ncbi:MAG: DUF6151 family protein, partial [Myxococcota bacterium]